MKSSVYGYTRAQLKYRKYVSFPPPTQMVEFTPRPIKNKTNFFVRFVVFSQKRNLEKSKILQIKRKNSFYLYRAGATEMVEFTDSSPPQ